MTLAFDSQNGIEEAVSRKYPSVFNSNCRNEEELPNESFDSASRKRVNNIKLYVDNNFTFVVNSHKVVISVVEYIKMLNSSFSFQIIISWNCKLGMKRRI